MKSQQPTITQKLTQILTNSPKLPPLYQPDATNLKPHIQTPPQKIPQNISIKIQTFYNLLQPALHSLHWQDPYQQNKYPVALVIANRGQSQIEEKYSIGVRFVNWVQSGGVRCIGVRPICGQGEIQRYIGLSHCAIFSDLGIVNQGQRKFIQNFITAANKQTYYPILFVGSSCIHALQILQKQKITVQKKQQTQSSQLYIDHNSKLFKGLDISLRLLFQNRKKLPYPYLKLTPSSSSSSSQSSQQQYQQFNITGHQILKNVSQLPTILQHKTQEIYLLLNQPCLIDHPDNIQLWHCLIVNFVNMAKLHKKDLDQKKVQKELIGFLKILYKGDKGYYRFN